MEEFIKKAKNFLTFEMIVLIVLGLSVGIYIKSIATHSFTVGFSDPKVQSEYEIYDIDALEQGLIAQGVPEEITPIADPGAENVTEGSITAQ